MQEIDNNQNETILFPGLFVLLDEKFLQFDWLWSVVF